MKVNKITLMVVGLAVASLIASCKKNNNNDVVSTDIKGFIAHTEQGGNSRTHGVPSGNSIAVQWTSGDKILVANQGGNGQKLTYTLKDGAGSTEGDFASFNESDAFLVPNYVAVYPATNAENVANNISGTTATFNLPATQTYLANSFAEKAMPMVAYSTEQTLHFKNVLGGICFPIVATGITVTRIELTSAVNEALWGTCVTTIATTSEESPSSSVTYSDAAQKTITLDCSANGGVALSSTATDFYIMVPPGTLENGFMVAAYNGENKIFEKSTMSAPGVGFISCNTVRKMNNSLEVIVETPDVTTISPTFISTNSALGIGSVDDTPSECGVLYALATTLSDPETDLVIGGGDGIHVVTTDPAQSFNVEMTNLTPDQLYYVRAYAKNNANAVGYGTPILFATRADYFNNVYEGKLKGQFTINSNGDKVFFSAGNLQYTTTGNHKVNTTPITTVPGTWRFAEYQYEYVGDATEGLVYLGGMSPEGANGEKCSNTNISSTYSGWIDMFGWGTSGCDLESTVNNYCYQPYDALVGYCSNYGPMGTYSLTGEYSNGDWGVYNAISNGGNVVGRWRTLQGKSVSGNGTNTGHTAEWNYILKERSSTNRYALVSLNNVRRTASSDGFVVNGMLIFPDSFIWPQQVSAIRYENYSSCSTNKLTEADWSLLERLGVVFLPFTGVRSGNTVSNLSSYGFYWSSTYYDDGFSYNLWLQNSTINPTTYYYCRHYGKGVRLVCPAN